MEEIESRRSDRIAGDARKPAPRDMMERVARALYEADCEAHDMRLLGHSWESDVRRQPAYRLLARAAVEALRQPDKAMLKAASAAMSPGKRPTQRYVSERAKHGIRFRAMIDALLTDGAPLRQDETDASPRGGDSRSEGMDP